MEEEEGDQVDVLLGRLKEAEVAQVLEVMGARGVCGQQPMHPSQHRAQEEGSMRHTVGLRQLVLAHLLPPPPRLAQSNPVVPRFGRVQAPLMSPPCHCHFLTVAPPTPAVAGRAMRQQPMAML